MPPLRVPTRLVSCLLATALCAALLPALAAQAPAAQAQAQPQTQAQGDGPSLTRLSGPSRLHTAAAVAGHTDPAGSTTVLVARADSYADALAGGPLAARLGAPVLLTSTTRLDDVAAGEVRRLGAARAILLGGTSALSPAVEDGLRAAGVLEIERLSGPSRFDTAAAIAAKVLEGRPAEQRRVYLAEGAHADPARGWPDALAASALAAADGSAILLASGPDLPEATTKALRRLQIAQAVVVGGRAALPESVETAVATTVAHVERVSGSNRFDTAARLADRAAARPGAGGRVWLASGANWPDALVAGPAAARTGGVLLLTDPGDLDRAPATRDWLASSTVTDLTVVGGAASVSDHVAAQARDVAARLPEITVPPVDLTDARRWSDAATWGGTKPAAGGTAVVPAGTTILLDEPPPHLAAIEVYGVLAVADIPLVIRTGSLMVHGPGARFLAGQESAPLRSKVEIVLDGNPSANVHGMGANVMGAMGGAAIDLHGTSPAVSWTRLAETAGVGSDTLVLQRAPGWQPGDEIVIASTSLDPKEAERRTVASVDGVRVRLSAPLSHTHWGATMSVAGREVPMHAEVGLLTRNLVVRGPDNQPTGFGGHTMAMEGAVFRSSGTEFARLGQRGVNARYPVHFHMLGDARGSYVRSSSVHTSNQRCITLHGSSNVLLADNVAYDAPGHCFFFEDGAETGNRLHRNLGLSTWIPEPGTALLDSDATPATYWVQHPGNELIGNVAAGSAALGFWYDLPKHPTGLSATTSITPRTAPMGTFSGNVAHSNAHARVFRSGSGLFIERYNPPSPALFSDFLAYKNNGFGIWAEDTRRVTVTGAVLAGNNIGYTGPGTTLRDSLIVGDTPNDATKPWVMLGLGFYHRGTEVSDVAFANFNHQGHRQHAAIGSIVHDSNDAARISRASFTNVADEARIRVTPQWADADPTRTPAFIDTDGSVTGAPAAIVADHPIMAGPGCSARPAWRGHVCPIGARFGMVMLADATGGRDALGPVTITRAGAGSGQVHSDPSWSSRPQSNFTVQYDSTYAATFGRATPRSLEVVLASDETSGDVLLSVPWPHAEVHVYRGWGEWAYPLTPGDPSGTDTFLAAGGTVTLRPYTDATSTWSRWMVCAERGCGQGIGSKRPGY